jgi:hypothetical protein
MRRWLAADKVVPFIIFIAGSFEFAFHHAEGGGLTGILNGEWMKRRFCFVLMLAAAFLAGPGGIPALMATDLPGGEAPAVTTVQSGEEQAEPKQMESERNVLGERKRRKSIGAEFWGGPYWGYGPRWGHPCEACRVTCENDREGSRCERCRVRCGW